MNEPALRECPGCGNPTPAASPECMHCGLQSPEAVVAAREAALARRFIYALTTRSNPFTYLFIGTNVVLFVLMWLSGGMGPMSTDQEVLVGFGAKVNRLIDEQNQYWRLVTSIFLHIGFLHLFFNNYALWIIGREIERLYGSSRFVILYLATGLIGSVASYYYNPRAASAGASGAIFGLFGLLATFAFRYRKEIPEAIRRDIKRRVIPLIVINLAIGFSIEMIDDSAHIGGLIAGIALGLVIPYKRPEERMTAAVWRALLVVCLAVIGLSFAAAFRNYSGPRPKLENLGVNPDTRAKEYLDRINDANKALIESINSFIEILGKQDEDADTKPALEAAERGIRSIKNLPKITDEVDLYRERLLEVLTEQRDIIERHTRSNVKNWAKTVREEEVLIKKAEEYKLIEMKKAGEDTPAKGAK